jgi:hypothetical protein
MRRDSLNIFATIAAHHYGFCPASAGRLYGNPSVAFGHACTFQTVVNIPVV